MTKIQVGKEDIIQITVMDWVRFNHLDDIIWHCANERSCSIQQGSLLKRKGVKAGVSDLFIARASRGYFGMFLELKSESGKLSELQSKFLATMHREGYATKCAYSADEAIGIIKDYLIMSST